jgi:zinc protease
VEQSSCALTGASDFWTQGIDAFSDVVLHPAFDQKDFDLEKMQLLAALESTPQDPERFANDIVNEIFYDKDHVFFSDYKQRIEHLKKLDTAALRAYHQKVFTAANIQITYVGNLSVADVKGTLDKKFGSLEEGSSNQRAVTPPVFDSKNYYSFLHRDLPNAYIRIKTNSPSRDSIDSLRASFVMNILSDKLWEELRTKRSLTYAVHSYSIPFTAGLAVLSVSTAKPKESLEAMDEVITSFKNTVLTKEEVDEFKPKFATTYFMRQETNGSIAGTIAGNYFYHNSLDRVFDYPTLLGAITPDDVKRIANEILKNFRVGVIYHQDKMKKAWVDSFVQKHI